MNKTNSKYKISYNFTQTSRKTYFVKFVLLLEHDFSSYILPGAVMSKF
jgi:hypothetical protein